MPPAAAPALTAALPEAPARTPPRAGPQGGGASQSVYHQDIRSVLTTRWGSYHSAFFGQMLKSETNGNFHLILRQG